MTLTKQQREDAARRIVEDAGGVYQGLQTIELPGLDDLVLFAWNPRASTMALKVSQLSVDNVRAKLNGVRV